MYRYHSRSHNTLSYALGFAMLTGGLVAAALLCQPRHRHGREDAPERSLRGRWPGAEPVAGRSVTIMKPREEVYQAWREFRRFPEFMENVISVEVLDRRRSKWVVDGPAGKKIEFISAITEDEPGRMIAWKSEEGAEVPNSGRVIFRDAPGGRGTEVDLEITYDPPGGAVGAAVARMFQRAPEIQSRRDLRRFKQLLETGEIATSATRPANGH